MAYTRDELLAALASEVQSRPMAALYYQAGDPRTIAQLGAIATMLSMVSAQIDIAATEPFQKTRDTTVLADATMKGILPFARPARMTLAVQNPTAGAVTIGTGRFLLDAFGRVYTTEVGATIAAGATGSITVKQMTSRTFTHTVSGSVPFYAVQIPPNDDADQVISGLYVTVGTGASAVSFPFTPEFQNLAADEPGFTIETDELRRLFVKFGWESTFGVQPTNGTVINFTIEETFGASDLTADAPFTFMDTVSTSDRQLTMKLASMIYPGADAINIETLREWARYPSGYDSSAVYLGNFDFLIRRNIFPFRFLSVWNEQLEESVRGANVASINKLFVAALMDGVDTTWMQAQIRQVVAAADDSYGVKFVPVVETPLAVTISAEVSVVHDTGDVQSQIKSAILKLYGRDSNAAQSGMLRLNSKRMAKQLETEVTALQDDGSDFRITIADLSDPLPEQFRYVSDASLTVTVTQATYNDGQWSH
jgi:hypothetical protein